MIGSGAGGGEEELINNDYVNSLSAGVGKSG